MVLCSGTRGYASPFVLSQVKSIRKQGVQVKLLLIEKGGIIGYLKMITKINTAIHKFKPNLIHAHYGFSGLLANIQRKIPVVTTYHGSDINIKRNKIFSFFSALLSKDNIFVHRDLPKEIRYNRKLNIIPVGVNLSDYKPIDKQIAKQILAFNLGEKYILFSSQYDNPVKNYPLALTAIKLLGKKYELIEMKGYSPYELNIMYNAVDVLLVTSHRETGPLVVKEAMACNLPIVSVDVGDVASVVGKTPGTYICQPNADELVRELKKAMKYGEAVGKTNGRKRIIELGLDSQRISKRILTVYNDVLKKS